MSFLVLKNCNLIRENDIDFGVDIKISGDKIFEIGRFDDDGIDCSNKFISAGFIDIHTHGGYGHDFMDGIKDAFDGVLKFHLNNGTTSVVATSVTAPKNDLLLFLQNCRDYKNREQKYATLLGAHLEGPYLSIRNKGAQKLECILQPDKDDYTFMEGYVDVIKSVTIAPELAGAEKMTKWLKDHKVLVCGGHDDGIYPEFIPSINAGLSHLTHIFCAMSELRFKNEYRNVGLREYGLIDENLTAEMIADNRHIPPQLAKMIYNAKGAKKLCLVSDSLRIAGLREDGKIYKLGKQDDKSAQQIKHKDGVAVLADESCFAGSITPISKMVKNLIEIGIPVCDAFRMGTKTPAEIIGEDDLGEIKVGAKADLCIFDDKFNLQQVIKNGIISR